MQLPCLHRGLPGRLPEGHSEYRRLIYLLAHHEVSGKPFLQPRAIGLGLVGGLLAELTFLAQSRPRMSPAGSHTRGTWSWHNPAAAQDVSLRDKRRALGRALAAGVDGESTVNDEFLFIRALPDLDEPYIVILQLIGTQPPINHPLPRGWLLADIVKRLPDYTAALPAILATLELHTHSSPTVRWPAKPATRPTSIRSPSQDGSCCHA